MLPVPPILMGSLGMGTLGNEHRSRGLGRTHRKTRRLFPDLDAGFVGALMLRSGTQNTCSNG
jgi:hypothetical protein